MRLPSLHRCSVRPWRSGLLGIRLALGLSAVLLAASSSPPLAAAGASFVRGDANADRAFSINDPVRLLSVQFLGSPAPLECEAAADANDDGQLNIADAVYMLGYLFLGAAAPPAPFPGCGADPTADGLSCVAFAPCGAGSAPGFHGTVFAHAVWRLDGGELSDLSPAELAQVRQSGVEIAGGTLTSLTLPLSGKYLEVGGQRRVIDRDGEVELDGPGNLTDVKVYWQAADVQPAAVLKHLEVAPPGVAATVSILEFDYSPPVDMSADAPGQGGGEAPGGEGGGSVPVAVDGCPLRTLAPGCPKSNSAPCCEDYLGPLGDREPRWRGTPAGAPFSVGAVCGARAHRNFIGSVCFEWVFLRRGMPCAPEVLPGGPNCWYSHKYRNCQNMDEDDFSLLPEGKKMKFAERLQFKVRNNTAANSTCLRIEPRAGEGELQLAPGSPPITLTKDSRCGGWRLDHWSDGGKKHYEEVTLVYVAPAKDSRGKCVATYTIHGEADGLKDKFEVRVLPIKNIWSGTTKRSQITQTQGLDNRIIATANVVFDLDSETVSGSLTYEETQTQPVCFLHGIRETPITPGSRTFLEVDLTTDPPTYRAGGATDVEIDIVARCEGLGQVTERFSIPMADWLDAGASTGGRYPASEDGCQLKGIYDEGTFGATHIFYEWDLKSAQAP